MRCLFCDNEIQGINLISEFIKSDPLCFDCRNKMRINRKFVQLTKDLKVETLYDYDEGLFKTMLIQYKECFDEALSDVFLYLLSEYIGIKYRGYKILFIPSSKEKLDARGFNHLEKIFKDVKLKRILGLEMKSEMIQEGKNLKQRKQMINNYIYKGEKAKKILLVDDVLTSGSSILGAYNAVKPYANRVKALALARKENAFI